MVFFRDDLPKKFSLFFSKDASMVLVSLNEQLFFSQSVVCLCPIAGAVVKWRSLKTMALRFIFFVLSRFGLGYSFSKSLLHSA